MTMEIKKVSAGIIAMLAVVGNAYATTMTCPAVASISQTKEGSGYAYVASAPDAKRWVGENPMAADDDLKKVHFKMASIQKEFVACDYEGKDDAAVRMSLKVMAKPVGKAWTGSICKNVSESVCTFE
ncbi:MULTISPECIES: DUF3757 domain-containing protein [unclassified Pseudomonas]|uniref:DUF3757 domain-containing protein n=1 Tax=unclassified Pseudomonas TaxID=196821 RepID=UPI000C86D566|nr:MULTISPECIES: DUF3757 domain-containing protein [unclassified Pseudomonas]PMV17971.1 hypothetical protein C1X17_27965 [Pseudomonas sp. FW305-3-2-15-C-TSA2]PMV19313.1 hypothetical protein C1X22_28655 [Pseudomonas sp. DP16D-L5]PMV33404.1 hypothetical protein C1X21_28890 [Pseudomonas sp. FW305-3-2-15-A-LB2]PMV38488.1 hypothetical protein C1X16_29000 [Pseudomonas sp. FW305-3-2-15-C-R2A1]PMV43554.1 hypothetical protein C1X18_28185 [Pseudomonas sp. FW305-3-2-15-C-LB1]